MYFSRSRSCTPADTPTTRIANFIYFDQAALISSAMLRRSTLSIGFLNKCITAKDTTRAAAKVAKSKKRNMGDHLSADPSNCFANENARGWQLSTIRDFRSVSLFIASNFMGMVLAILLC